MKVIYLTLVYFLDSIFVYKKQKVRNCNFFITLQTKIVTFLRIVIFDLLIKKLFFLF